MVASVARTLTVPAAVRAAALVAALALAACAQAPEATPGPSPGGEETPGGQTPTPPDTEEPTEHMDNADQSITGALGGSQELEGGCAWLETGDAGRHEILWPDGYQVQFEPVQLLGPDGEVVASEGDRVTVHGRPADDMASICMVGPIFEASEVEAGQ